MRIFTALASVLSAGFLWPSVAAADVTVNFIAPEHYYDANLYGGYGGKRYDRTLKELATTFHSLGERYLAPGDQLTIDVLDVDLAGEYELYSVSAYDIRLLSNITWPRIKMRYVLTRADAPPISGEEQVSDPNYMTFPNFRSGTETMSYEKAMLQRWFKQRFAKPN